MKWHHFNTNASKRTAYSKETISERTVYFYSYPKSPIFCEFITLLVKVDNHNFLNKIIFPYNYNCKSVLLSNWGLEI